MSDIEALKAAHDKRVSDLLKANNREVERRRAAERMLGLRLDAITSEGAFREGARAMRDAIAGRIGREWPGPAAQIAEDTALPDFSAPPAKPETGWQWWAGSNDEWYTVGPCATRDEALAEGANGFCCDDGFYIVEALPGTFRLSADSAIERDYYEADDLFSLECGAEPDRIGGADLIATADAELQALMDAWLARWRHTFVTPSLFAATRNREFIRTTGAVE